MQGVHGSLQGGEQRHPTEVSTHLRPLIHNHLSPPTHTHTLPHRRLTYIADVLFPRGQRGVQPKDTPLNIFVKLIQFIAKVTIP